MGINFIGCITVAQSLDFSKSLIIISGEVHIYNIKLALCTASVFEGIHEVIFMV
jgi:hypothetical protein